jgi:hypothetical protein
MIHSASVTGFWNKINVCVLILPTLQFYRHLEWLLANRMILPLAFLLSQVKFLAVSVSTLPLQESSLH